MKKKILSIILGMLLLSTMVACGSDSTTELPTTTSLDENGVDSPTSTAMDEQVADSSNLTLMVAELPDWAVVYNETADEPLAVQDIAITLLSNSYTSTLLSAQQENGTYTYNAMTGEYMLSGGGAIVEDMGSYTFLPNGDETAECKLVAYAQSKELVAELNGEGEILASGEFPMTITFVLALYDDYSYELANMASPAIMTGTWEKNADGSLALTGEGAQTLSSTFDADSKHVSVAIETTMGEYEFELVLEGIID